MEPVAIASAVAGYLTPYLAKAGGKAAEEVGKKLPEVAGKLWNAVTTRFKHKPAAEEAAKDLVANPEDDDNVVSFRKELKKLLESDPAFAEEIAGLLKSAQEAEGEKILVTGSGAAATRGGVAAGKGGIAIKGDVHGGVSIVNERKDR